MYTHTHTHTLHQLQQLQHARPAWSDEGLAVSSSAEQGRHAEGEIEVEPARGWEQRLGQVLVDLLALLVQKVQILTQLRQRERRFNRPATGDRNAGVATGDRNAGVPAPAICEGRQSREAWSVIEPKQEGKHDACGDKGGAFSPTSGAPAPHLGLNLLRAMSSHGLTSRASSDGAPRYIYVCVCVCVCVFMYKYLYYI